MTHKDDGGNAFPQGKSETVGSISVTEINGGMTLRDWFAGQFLAGASVEDSPLDQMQDESVNSALARYWAEVANAAYIAADAMIKARNK